MQALNLYSLKHCEFKKARSDYSVALEQFNLYQRTHYAQTLVNWGNVGQSMEAQRIAQTQELISVLVERLKVTIDQLTAACTALESAGTVINAKQVRPHF